MDSVSLAASRVSAQIGRLQLEIAGKMLRMEADPAQSAAATVEAARQEVGDRVGFDAPKQANAFEQRTGEIGITARAKGREARDAHGRDSLTGNGSDHSHGLEMPVVTQLAILDSLLGKQPGARFLDFREIRRRGFRKFEIEPLEGIVDQLGDLQAGEWLVVARNRIPRRPRFRRGL